MPTYELELIPKPNDTPVITVEPLFVTKIPAGITAALGRTNYSCGACGMILLGSMDGGVRFVGMPIRCGICGAYNLSRGKFAPGRRNKYFLFPILPPMYQHRPLVRALRVMINGIVRSA